MTQQRLKTFIRALFPRVRRNYFDELGSWAELWKRLLTITPRPGATRKRCEAEKEVERACRPDSVRRNAGVTIIRLGDRLPGRSSHLPARSGGPPCAVRRPHACLFDVAPDGVWRAGRVATSAVSSYLTLSPLPSAPANRQPLGRCAFCSTFRRPGPRGLLRLAVSQHPALWSPDLPPATAPARRNRRSSDPLRCAFYDIRTENR